MVRRALAISILLILVGVLFLGPAFETIDRWDNVPQTGNDTLLSLVLLLTCAGAMLAITRLVLLALAFIEYLLTTPDVCAHGVMCSVRRLQFSAESLPTLAAPIRI